MGRPRGTLRAAFASAVVLGGVLLGPLFCDAREACGTGRGDHVGPWMGREPVLRLAVRTEYRPSRSEEAGTATKRRAGTSHWTARERWWAVDKAKHLGGSCAGTLGLAWGLHSLGMAEGDCATWAGASVLALGLFKEIAMDRENPRSCASWKDGAANLVGVIAGAVIWHQVRD